MEQRSLIERLARHLATDTPENWPDRVEDAASILALLREPDAPMREAGDGAIWEAMIDAALRTRWTVGGKHSQERPDAGADEEGETSLTPQAVGHDRADWVHVRPKSDDPTPSA